MHKKQNHTDYNPYRYIRLYLVVKKRGKNDDGGRSARQHQKIVKMHQIPLLFSTKIGYNGNMDKYARPGGKAHELSGTVPRVAAGKL